MSKDYPDTAALLLRRAPEILRRWDRRVRRQIPASRAQQPLVLQNHLGPLLVEVAKALSPSLISFARARSAAPFPNPAPSVADF